MLWGAVGTGLFMAWAVQPRLRLEGQVVPGEQAAGLLALVDELRQRLDVPPIDEIRLEDAEFNAGVLELAPTCFRWRTRRILLLGVPFLATVDAAALRAVIAHELGHFSRRHGRLGHWLYRARAAWLWRAQPADPLDSPLERALGHLARRFGPWFARHSFSHSRACEYEADADAAALAGPQELARALVQVSVIGARLRVFQARGWRAAVRCWPEAPAGWTGIEQAQVGCSAFRAEEIRAVLDAEPATAEDTHPRVAERCAALGVDVPDAAQVQPAAACAGAEILGASWPLQVNERDRRWQAAHRRTWAMDHAASGILAARHAELLAQAVDTPERWRLEPVLGEAVDAAAWAVRAASAAAQTPEGLYLVGRALLEQGNAEGVPWLRRCIQAEANWTVPARRILADLGRRFLDATEARQNEVLLQRARARRLRVDEQVAGDLLRGSLPAADLAPWQRAALAAALRVHPAVREAWVLAGTASPGGHPHQACLLVARLDTAVLQAEGIDEDTLAEDLCGLLLQWLPENCQARVQTRLTTEPLEPGLQRGLAALPAACVPLG
jgi:Zn-dependent protease with chaperone function